jgi:hypothetical protein
MHVRTAVPFVLIAAAIGCSTLSEAPTAPGATAASSAFLSIDPPPPPIDTGSVVSVDNASYTTTGRYFENRPGSIVWLAFNSSVNTLASPDARLQYNTLTGRTLGTGSLTSSDGKVLLLSQVTFAPRLPGENPFVCLPPDPRVDFSKCEPGALVGGGSITLFPLTPRTAQ